MAFATVHCLLLHNVYSTYFGVSSHSHGEIAALLNRLLLEHFVLACVLQTPCSSELLSASVVGERPHQCPSLASKASSFSSEQRFPGPGSPGGQLPLPALLTHPGQLIPHHKYPLTFQYEAKITTCCVSG